MRSVAVELVLDEERFYEVAKQTFDSLMTQPDAVRRLCQHPQWLADGVTATMEARDAATAAQAVAHAAWNERLEVRAVLTLGHAIVEGPSKFVLASLLAARTGSAYERLRNEDASVLVTRFESAGQGASAIGIDKAVRNAHGHTDWRLTDDGVEFRPGKAGSRTFAVDDLSDLVLTGVESLLALDTALMLAAAAVGTDFAELDWRKALNLNDASAARLMLAMAGWEDVLAETEDSTLVITGRAPDSAFSMATVGALTLCLGPDLDRLRLSVTIPNGRVQTLEGPVAALREFGEASGDADKGAAMVALLRSFELDREPIASQAHLRRWVAKTTLQALQAPLPTAIHLLRLVRSVGLRVHDQEVVIIADGSMQLARRMAMGDVADLTDTVAFKTLAGWEKLHVDPLSLVA